MAVPRMSPFGDDSGVAWPRPLDLSEAARLRRIMNLQRRGTMALAARETAQLDTSTPLGDAMLGTVLAQRYLGPYSRPDVPALRAWLARWPRLPDAPLIHALLLARLPSGGKPAPATQPRPAGAGPEARPEARVAAKPGPMPMSPPVPEETSPAEQAIAHSPDLDRSVADAARHRGPIGVRRLLARTSGLTGSYASLLLGEAARALFAANQDQAAHDLAAEGLHACNRWGGKDCQPAAIAGFAGGLAAWRMGRADRSRAMFEAAWHSPLTTPSLRAAAAFWTARTHEQAGREGPRLLWLRRAAAQRDTFYGLLAQRALGIGAGGQDAGHAKGGNAGRDEGRDAGRDEGRDQGRDNGWDGARETLAQADVDAIAATEEGLRAFAFLQIDDQERAEAELRALSQSIAGRPEMTRAVMLVADHAGLSGLAAQLADLLQARDGRPRDQTRFRVPRLRPEGGFRLDPALVFAVARTESDFNTAATSAAGAVGVMQIMPGTARFITAQPGRPRPASMARLRDMLADPAANMALGQRYLDYLAHLDPIEGSLLHVLASYNCGPSRLAQWVGDVRSFGDPLLFIEAIPIDETRAYVPRVLTYTWLYARRLRLPTPTLDALAQGNWPAWKPIGTAGPFPTLH